MKHASASCTIPVNLLHCFYKQCSSSDLGLLFHTTRIHFPRDLLLQTVESYHVVVIEPSIHSERGDKLPDTYPTTRE